MIFQHKLIAVIQAYIAESGLGRIACRAHDRDRVRKLMFLLRDGPFLREREDPRPRRFALLERGYMLNNAVFLIVCLFNEK
jgi:hypothetical protein